ncbi:16S rRNA (uracil(1498)-N(3))-methyltransferase [Butyrivibrio sp. INlla16]|uniref:RsmE family RNA methyltransferase n=1 Tax=Butyrivibrio sp. INlla16 TaxID=1520807 RepID=UPI00088703F0|nr:16S rRNA (uracil(1498)-N(3))-methyltransferase [Butyrivibrio sp. INlla16]SDB35775.1 16S rRNA (uracil1498-N3)-methyltransferase [Butyrivibrio sp. INlla16]
MYHFFASSTQLIDNQKRIVITGDDYNHMVNVLRMKPGEEFSVSLMDEDAADQKEYRFGIESISDTELIGELRFIKESGAELPSKIYLFQGLPKADKMELIIQKAVELGAFQIIPVSMKRSVVKLDEKRAVNKIKRWNAISEAAAKQSKRGVIPEVKAPMTFKEAVKYAESLDVKLLPYEMAEGMEYTREVIDSIEPGQSIGIFVGPEGGFADEEISYAGEAGFKTITMGKRILRTETAGFTMLAWLMYNLEV